MARRLSVWSRIAYLLDAIGLMKLLGAAAVFVLFDGSPLFALGIVFATPVIAACVVLIVRLLCRAANGEWVDWRFLDERQRSRTGRPSSVLWAREQPPSRSFVRTHIDVTPIKYRQVRSSVNR